MDEILLHVLMIYLKGDSPEVSQLRQIQNRLEHSFNAGGIPKREFDEYTSIIQTAINKSVLGDIIGGVELS